MESWEIVFHLRSSYYLGNYSKVIDFWKEVSQLQLSPEFIPEIHSFVCRAFVHLTVSNEKQAKALAPLLQSLLPKVKVYARFLSPLLLPSEVPLSKDLLKSIGDHDFSDMSPFDKITIYNLAAAFLGDFNHLITEFGQGSQSLVLETLSISTTALLECNQLDKADKHLEKMRSVSDDDILTNITTVQRLIHEVTSLS
jgi:Coatomer epsilon subunit